MHIEWGEMLRPDVPILELFIRGTAVYLVAFVLLRTFKRESGSTATTDLLVLVLIADAAQNGMSKDYQSLTDGLFLVATIVFWSLTIDAISYRWGWAEKIAKPKPVLLIEGGRFNRRNMRRELVTEGELRSELRKRGVHDLADVDSVQMEPDGEISVVPKEEAGGDRKDGKTGEKARRRLRRTRQSRR
jgi:uncharacterized membrane protein YcaP (DUF421 family)